MKVAKDSFSHLSSQKRIVTRSPNHWCAISCAITQAMVSRSSRELARGSASRKVSV